MVPDNRNLVSVDPPDPASALAERMRLAELTATIGISLTAAANLEETLSRCARALVEHLGVAFARIWVLDARGQTLELIASEGLYTYLNGTYSRVAIGQLEIGWIAQERKAHITNSVLEDPRIQDREWVQREDLVAFAGYPLLVGDRLLGVMAMFSRAPLSQAMQDALHVVAHGIALRIERRRWEQALLASQTEVQRILQSITDGFASLDAELRLKYVNKEGAQLLGRSVEDLVGRTIHEVFPTITGSDFEAALRRTLTGQTEQEVEKYFPPLGGWFNLRAFPSDEGVTAYFRNVTDRKLAEQRLLAQYAVSRTLNAEQPVEQIIPNVLAEVGTHLGWSLGFLWIVNRKPMTLSCSYAWQAPERAVPEFVDLSRSISLRRGEGLPGLVWQAGELHWVRDFARKSFPRSKAAERAALHAAIAFPIFARGEITAVAEFLTSEMRPPDAELTRTITAIGHQIGQYLERQSTVEALKESELRKSAILNAALDAIITIDADSRIVEFNPAAESTFGYKRDDVIGKPIPDLIIPPRFRQEHSNGLKRFLTTGEARLLGRRLELTAMRSDGSEFPVEVAITRVPVQGNVTFTAFLRDITDAKRSEFERAQLLARAEGAQRYYQVLTQALPQQVWTATPEGELDFVNKGVAEYFGRPPEELLGSGWIQFVHPEDMATCAEKWKLSLKSAEPYEINFRLRRFDGEYRWHLGRALPVSNASGQVTKWLGTNTDVHDRIEAEQELRRAKEAAESASEAKSHFLANMSHELRTPLNAIIGYSEMLEEEAAEQDLEPFASDLPKVHNAGKHLLSLINDVLDLSKIEAGRMELYVETFDVRSMVVAVSDTIRPLAERNGNQFTVEVEPDVSTMASDLTKVRQSLLNLLSNASKFTEKGSITLSTSKFQRDGQDWYEFRVVDTGIGIPESHARTVFEPFSQVDKGRGRRFGGTGLGLAITKRFAEMMGGSITLESTLGKGSTFRIQLPSRTTVPEQYRPSEQDKTARPNTVLVIDDDPAAQELMRRVLQKEGFHTVSATSGQQALRLVREIRPVAITLDVMMPGMDGWTVLTALKSDSETAEIPVIVVSIVDDKNLGYSLGASEYLTKPIDRERFSNVLDRYRCSGDNCPVLVVDDDDAARQTLRSVLERHGWRVIEAANGKAALEQMREETPELILLDLMMPEMNGFEFSERLREQPEWRNIPVIILTSMDLTADERLQLKGNVERILSKESFKISDLIGEICRIARVDRARIIHG